MDFNSWIEKETDKLKKDEPSNLQGLTDKGHDIKLTEATERVFKWKGIEIHGTLIDNEFYQISAADAQRLQEGKPLRLGYKRQLEGMTGSGNVTGRVEYWLIRTPHHDTQVWAIMVWHDPNDLPRSVRPMHEEYVAEKEKRIAAAMLKRGYHYIIIPDSGEDPVYAKNMREVSSVLRNQMKTTTAKILNTDQFIHSKVDEISTEQFKQIAAKVLEIFGKAVATIKEGSIAVALKKMYEELPGLLKAPTFFAQQRVKKIIAGLHNVVMNLAQNPAGSALLIQAQNGLKQWLAQAYNVPQYDSLDRNMSDTSEKANDTTVEEQVGKLSEEEDTIQAAKKNVDQMHKDLGLKPDQKLHQAGADNVLKYAKKSPANAKRVKLASTLSQSQGNALGPDEKNFWGAVDKNIHECLREAELKKKKLKKARKARRK
jgi:hypothetical protein